MQLSGTYNNLYPSRKPQPLLVILMPLPRILGQQNYMIASIVEHTYVLIPNCPLTEL